MANKSKYKSKRAYLRALNKSKKKHDNSRYKQGRLG